MDDNDSDSVERPDEVTHEEQVGRVANAGGNVPGTEGTTTGMGTLAGGLVGAIAARDIMDSEIPEEERVAGDSERADIFGDKSSRTADQGVSPSQKEAEADELNG